MRSSRTKESGSWFASIAGMALLLGLFILSSYFGLANLAAFLLVVLFVVLLSFIWGKFSLKSVEVVADTVSCNVFPGEDIRINLSTINDKALPVIWINVRYFDVKPVFLADDAELNHRISWLMPRQKASWTTSLKTRSRGIAFMESITASSGDGFGLYSEEMEFPLRKPPMIVVYPRVFPVDVGRLLENSSSPLASERGCIADETQFKGIHDYRYGDSIKHLNWRILARQGELAVNEYQPVIPRLVTFVLDLLSFTTWREEVTNSGVHMVLDSIDSDALEEMISLTASCILDLTGRKILCSLVIPAFGDKEMRVIEGNGDAEQIPMLLTELAGLQYNGEECSFGGLSHRVFSLGRIWMVARASKASIPLEAQLPDPRDAGLMIYSGDGTDCARTVLELQTMRRKDG